MPEFETLTQIQEVVTGMINDLKKSRKETLLSYYNLEFSDQLTSEQEAAGLPKSVTVRLKDSSHNRSLARCYYGSSEGVHIQFYETYNGLNDEQRAVVMSLVGSYCESDRFPELGDGPLSGYNSDELHDFFKKLYLHRSSAYETATRILSNF